MRQTWGNQATSPLPPGGRGGWAGRYLTVLWAGVALAVTVPGFFILPGADDWTTSVPILDWEWSNLLPGLFWRPLEQIFRGPILGSFPGLYPFLPHLAALSGHLLSGGMVVLLVRELLGESAGSGRCGGSGGSGGPVGGQSGEGDSRIPALMAGVLFMVMPGAMAGAWSLDSMIQTWSTGCGLYGLWLVLGWGRGRGAGTGRGGDGAGGARGGSGARYRWLWVLPCWGAVLFKESGIAWFLAVPLFWLFREVVLVKSPRPGGRVVKEFLLLLVVGAGGVLVYFGARFGLSGVVGLGAEPGSRYGLHWDLNQWAAHWAMLVGVAGVPVDTVALLGREPDLPRVVASLLPSVPFYVLLGRAAGGAVVTGGAGGGGRRWGFHVFAVGCVLAILGVLAAPHLPMGSVSEMYAHPLVAVLAIFAGVLVGKDLSLGTGTGIPIGTGIGTGAGAGAGAGPAVSLSNRRVELWAVVVTLFVVGSLMVNHHKFTEMGAGGLAARAVGERINALVGPEPAENLCIYRFRARGKLGYSVFQMRPDQASGWGRSVISHWGWRLPAGFLVIDYPGPGVPTHLEPGGGQVRAAMEVPDSCEHVIGLAPDGSVFDFGP